MKRKLKRRREIPKAMEKYKWKPGVSGNPNGRPPNPRVLSDTYREVLEYKVVPTLAKRLAKAFGLDIAEVREWTMKQAIAFKATVESCEELFTRQSFENRLEGKSAETLNLNQRQGKILSDEQKEHLAASIVARTIKS